MTWLLILISVVLAHRCVSERAGPDQKTIELRKTGSSQCPALYFCKRIVTVLATMVSVLNSAFQVVYKSLNTQCCCECCCLSLWVALDVYTRVHGEIGSSKGHCVGFSPSPSPSPSRCRCRCHWRTPTRWSYLVGLAFLTAVGHISTNPHTKVDALPSSRPSA